MNAVIVVPLDGSPLAEQALPVAAKLAQGLDAELLLTHVIDPMATHIVYHEGQPWTIEDERRQMRSNATYYLNNRCESWAKTGTHSSLEVIEGNIGEGVVELATRRRARFIVMTTHAKTGLARVALGSVADYVMRESPCPVVLVPPHKDSLPLHFAPLRTILVPLDGSLFSEAALPHAKTLARAFDAELHLFRVANVTPVPALTPARVPHMPVMSTQDKAITERYLARVQSELVAGSFRVDSHLGVGPAGDAIIEHAEAIHADLIVMTTHARTGFARTVLGSTADHVVRAGTIPVFLVRPE